MKSHGTNPKLNASPDENAGRKDRFVGDNLSVYEDIQKVGISASIYELERGKAYAGFVKFDDFSDMFKYHLNFSRNLEGLMPDLKRKPLSLISATRFELRDYKTDQKVPIEDYSECELIGVMIGGAKSMLEGRYWDVNGAKRSFAKAKIRLTDSVKSLLSKCLREEKK